MKTSSLHAHLFFSRRVCLSAGRLPSAWNGAEIVRCCWRLSRWWHTFIYLYWQLLCRHCADDDSFHSLHLRATNGYHIYVCAYSNRRTYLTYRNAQHKRYRRRRCDALSIASTLRIAHNWSKSRARRTTTTRKRPTTPPVGWWAGSDDRDRDRNTKLVCGPNRACAEFRAFFFRGFRY